MILPSNEKCREVIDSLMDDPELTEWEAEFVESNLDRLFFTDRQRETIARLMEKYEV